MCVQYLLIMTMEDQWCNYVHLLKQATVLKYNFEGRLLEYSISVHLLQLHWGLRDKYSTFTPLELLENVLATRK